MKAEEQLQRAVVDLLAIYENRGLLCFAHVPNGGYRSPAQAGAFKAMGVRAGVPDLIVWTHEGHSFGIELKAGRGKESDAQILWKSTLESLGHRVYVAWSLDEVEAALRLERVPQIGVMAGGRSLDAVEASAGVSGRKNARGHPAGAQRVLEAMP